MGSYSRPLVVFLALLSVSAFFLFFKRPERFLASQEGTSLRDGYCLAIRGNGEAMPAHWGGLANTIEAFGIPSGVAGGSSASITSFLLESVLMNPAIGESEKEEKISFLIKSFEGLMEIVAEKPGWKELVSVIGAVNAGEKKSAIAELQRILEAQSPEQILLQGNKLTSALQEIQRTGILNGPAIVRLAQSFRKWKENPTEEKKIQMINHLKEVKQAFDVLGSFDAKGDKFLFLRNGVIDFGALARLFGRMGDFYSLSGGSHNTQKLFQSWLSNCSRDSAGKSWPDLVRSNRFCRDGMKNLLDAYFTETKNENYRIHERVGSFLPALISTSVVMGASMDSAKRVKSEYDERSFGSFSGEIQFQQDDFKFGYWGAENDLQRVQGMIRSPRFPGSRLDKSKRYFSLGEAEWITPLSLSPAEPGLSAFLEFEGDKGKLLSFGGWSDLHPVPVLKALGCGRVVYLTRVGGDSLFSQGVAKRILRLDDIEWDDLDSQNPAAVRKNNSGTRENQNGTWSQMFNLANSRSSFSVSLAMADAVVCTNWNEFDVKKGFRLLIEDSYSAPVFMRSEGFGKFLREPKRIFKSDNTFDSALGYPKFAGCIYP